MSTERCFDQRRGILERIVWSLTTRQVLGNEIPFIPPSSLPDLVVRNLVVIPPIISVDNRGPW